MTVAGRIAAALAEAGVDTMFGLPGGGANLDLIGTAADRGIRFVLAHAETEAAIMASTHGLLTGRPTPVVATRGPGAASLANGVAQATLDRYPLVAITDTVPSVDAARVAHQRLDQRALLGTAAKSSATIGPATGEVELSSLVAAATEWPYGAVHLDVDGTAAAAGGSQLRSNRALSPVSNEAAGEMLGRAERPVVIAGMEAAAAAHRAGDGRLRAAIEALGCPVLTTYQAIGLVDTEGPHNAGLFTNGALERPVLESADVVIAVGLDMVEPIPAPWPYSMPVVRLSAVADHSGYLPVAVDVIAELTTSVEALAAAGVGHGSWEPDTVLSFRRAARQRLTDGGGASFGPVELVDALAPLVPAAATVTVDAGAHFLAVMPRWPVAQPFGLLISNGLATMGFAVPAAIGAAVARPGDPVLALTGDGGLSMTLAELETIARLGLPITVVVFNDGALSLIEIKQLSGHGGPGAVRYAPVDFAAIARASGLAGVVVTSTDELAAAVAEDWDRPRLIDARIDPTPYRHLITATRG